MNCDHIWAPADNRHYIIHVSVEIYCSRSLNIFVKSVFTSNYINIDLILTRTIAELYEKIKVYGVVINTPFLVCMYLVCIIDSTSRKLAWSKTLLVFTLDNK